MTGDQTPPVVFLEKHMRTPLNGLRAPYSLPSNVIYFTDWRYVYPGAVGWKTADGESGRLWSKEDVPGGFHWQPTDMPRGICIRAQEAEKSEFFITQDKSWERFIIWCTLIHDQGRHRLWYGACPPSGFDTPVPNLADLLCYAESDDGFNWKKPALGISDFEGETQTNIVFGGPLAGENGHHGGTVFVDPSAPAAERYKLIYMGRATDEEFEACKRERPDEMDPFGIRRGRGYVFGVYGATSPDGLNWTRLPGPLVLQNSDTQTTAAYDAVLKKYVAYFRTWYFDRRCVGRSETDDFRRWPMPENILCPDATLTPSEQWYTNAKTLYPGTSDYHLMFPALYRVSDDSMEVHVFSSADDINWSAVPGGPVLRPGAAGEKDAGCVAMGCGLVPLPGDRVAAPFLGFPIPHKYPRVIPIGDIAYATWPRGRLAALEAPEEGEFALSPLRIEATRVLVNVQTRRAGHVLVEAADEKGNPLPGRTFADADPITGDYLSHEVTWRGRADIRHVAGAALRLRFRMSAAKLFSVEFTD